MSGSLVNIRDKINLVTSEHAFLGKSDLSFSVLCLLCLCVCLFICALWSPAGKGLASRLSFCGV